MSETGHNYKDIMDGWFSIIVNRPFYKNRSFYALLFVPVAMVFFVCCQQAFGSEQGLGRCCSYNTEAFDRFFELMRAPLIFTSFATGVAIMYARFHQSAQFNKNIEVMEAKNDFDRRFKHEEEFLKYLGGINVLKLQVKQTTFTFKLNNDHRAYLRFFPDNTSSVSGISVSKKLLSSRLTTLAQTIEMFKPDGVFSFDFDAAFDAFIMELQSDLGLTYMARHPDSETRPSNYLYDLKKEFLTNFTHIYSPISLFLKAGRFMSPNALPHQGAEVSRVRGLLGLLGRLKDYR